jgi:nanoRNase/pAp phosphatase (c-di-AMP/oligoRNAs hydrolase)
MSRLTCVDGMYYSYYNEDDLARCQIEKEEAEIGTQMLQSIEYSDIVVIFKIKSEFIHFSLRSRMTTIDHIARHYGG